MPAPRRSSFLYSIFPFVYPCEDVSTTTVIKCLNDLFSIFGMSGYVHSDRGTSFMSQELKQYLHTKGIATSRTTSFNPAGNVKSTMTLCGKQFSCHCLPKVNIYLIGKRSSQMLCSVQQQTLLLMIECLCNG